MNRDCQWLALFWPFSPLKRSKPSCKFRNWWKHQGEFGHGPCATWIDRHRSSPLQGVLEKGVLKIYSKFTGEHPYWSVISIKLQSNFFEITLWHGCPPVSLLYICRTPCPKNTSGRLPVHLWWTFFGQK